MKQWQALVCLVVILVTGFLAVAICNNSKTTVQLANVPEPEIIWAEKATF